MTATGEQKRIVVVLGTRPEAIKLAPLLRLLRDEPRLAPSLVLTGQHREMVDQVLLAFELRADVDLSLMRPDQRLNAIAAECFRRLDETFDALRPDMVVVQGDTTSAMAAAWAAFHRRIPVAHVEAGLRSDSLAEPFPEEANRRAISLVAALHLAPTALAAKRLLAEGVPPGAVHVTGNTTIDALLAMLGGGGAAAPVAHAEDMVLITLHRRESWAEAAQAEDDGERRATPLEECVLAIGAVARRHPDTRFLFPVHRNPHVRRVVEGVLSGIPNVALGDPAPYPEFVAQMGRARVIVSDSGGVQEEAPALGVPVLVLRRVTERPEALGPGRNLLVGTAREAVESALEAALAQPLPAPRALPRPNPYGDGRAAARSVAAILHYFGLDPAPHPFVAEAASPGEDPAWSGR